MTLAHAPSCHAPHVSSNGRPFNHVLVTCSAAAPPVSQADAKGTELRHRPFSVTLGGGFIPRKKEQTCGVQRSLFSTLNIILSPTLPLSLSGAFPRQPHDAATPESTASITHFLYEYFCSAKPSWLPSFRSKNWRSPGTNDPVSNTIASINCLRGYSDGRFLVTRFLFFLFSLFSVLSSTASDVLARTTLVNGLFTVIWPPRRA